MLRIASLALVLPACTASTFSAQVVSCSDRKPLPEARLSYTALDGAPPPHLYDVDELPARTGDTGHMRAEVEVDKGTTYLMSVEKKGYAARTAPITSGKEEVICLDPVE